MKKAALLTILSIFFLMPDLSVASTVSTQHKTSKSSFYDGGRKNKNGQYRRKKGFLWGLFKGKNACDCPKH